MKKMLIIPIMLILLVGFVFGVTPNPGHPFSEVGAGNAPGTSGDIWSVPGIFLVSNYLTTNRINVGTGGFYMNTGAPADYVLTVDDVGRGTWQPASGGGGLWTQSGDNIYYDAGRVGVGATPDSSNVFRVYSTNSFGLEVETPLDQSPTIRMTKGTESWSIQHLAPYLMIAKGNQQFKIYENAPTDSLVVQDDGTININEKIASSSGDVIIRLG